MNNDNFELRKSCVESAKQIHILTNQLQKLLMYRKFDVLFEYISVLAQLKEDLVVICSTLGYDKYNDVITQVDGFCNSCKTEIYLADHSNLFGNILDHLEHMMNQISSLQEKTCFCCGKKGYYLPLNCEWQQKKWGVELHEPETLNLNEYYCPSCMSSDRDRLIVSFLKWIQLDMGVNGESLLQIAPAKSIEHWIHANCPSLTYHSTDLFMDDVTFRSDIQCMSTVQDDHYDYVICSHVLEHVQDDRKALSELYRILKSDGMCIFLVPLEMDAVEIDEEWGLSEAENWKRFGQGDHCRRYAKKEMLERVQNAGFVVHQLDEDFFGQETFSECGLKESSVLYVLTKHDMELKKIKELRNRKRLENCGILPLVSVIMPSYNHENYVAAAIESVLNQTYSNFEFIVGDDGSTDGTVNEILKYEDKIDQVHLFESNTATKLVGFLQGLAKGKYIAMMHSDDLWKPEKLQMQVDYLENHPECAACFTGCSSFFDDGEDSEHIELFRMQNMSREAWIRYFYNNGNCLAHPSVLIRRDIYIDLTKNKGANMFRQLPDFYMWLLLLQEYDIHVIERELTLFRNHQKGENQNTSAQTQENLYRHYIEDSYIWYSLIKNMKKETFLNVFGDSLINKNPSTENEILCEKFFVLYGKRNRAALLFCYDIFQVPEIQEMLEKEYSFRNVDVYKLSGAVT